MCYFHRNFLIAIEIMDIFFHNGGWVVLVVKMRMKRKLQDLISCIYDYDEERKMPIDFMVKGQGHSINSKTM
jgi:hypothetical protein